MNGPAASDGGQRQAKALCAQAGRLEQTQTLVNRRKGMRSNLFRAAMSALAVAACLSPAAFAVERVVLCEEFTATN